MAEQHTLVVFGVQVGMHGRYWCSRWFFEDRSMCFSVMAGHGSQDSNDCPKSGGKSSVKQH
jgi:hypothetical protein